MPATFGVVLAAVYLLWAYQRVFHGPVTNEANAVLPDMRVREWAMLAPVIALIIFIGVYPKPFLERLRPSAERFVARATVGLPGSAGSELVRMELAQRDAAGGPVPSAAPNPLRQPIRALPSRPLPDLTPPSPPSQ